MRNPVIHREKESKGKTKQESFLNGQGNKEKKGIKIMKEKMDGNRAFAKGKEREGAGQVKNTKLREGRMKACCVYTSAPTVLQTPAPHKAWVPLLHPPPHIFLRAREMVLQAAPQPQSGSDDTEQRDSPALSSRQPSPV